MLLAADLTGDETVLDIAARGGHASLAFAPRVKKVVSLHRSREMLDEERQLVADRGLTNVEMEQGSPDRIPHEAATFDLITCRIGAHHFQDVKGALAEFSRVLKPRGKLLVVDNYAPDGPELDEFINHLDKLRDATHLRQYRLDEWEALFESHGLAFGVADRWETPHDFEEWAAERGASAATRVEMRRALVKAPVQAVETFRISTEPEFAFSHLRALIIGRARAA